MQSGGNVVGNGQDTGKSGFDRNALPHETPDRLRGLVGSRLLGAIMWPWGWVKNITSRSAGAPTSSAASSALMVCALRSMDACTHELFWAGSQGQGGGRRARWDIRTATTSSSGAAREAICNWTKRSYKGGARPPQGFVNRWAGVSTSRKPGDIYQTTKRI